MISNNAFRLAVLPGDGIGQEVMPLAVAILETTARRLGGFALELEWLDAGAGTYQETGTALPEATFEAASRADAVLLGAMGLPQVRYPDGTEIAPQLDLRFELELYAGVRPIRAIPALPSPLADPRGREIDFVIIRESTEGLFASRGKGTIENDVRASDTMVITRGVSERLFDFSFELAGVRREKGWPGRVTCVDKANVFRSFAFFRKIFEERAQRFPDLEADHAYIDATALHLVRRPWDFDVMVTENMFGDILSDLGAALIGGMGFAPSADIGERHAVFQPSHGSAPDIAGTGRANPTAMILSAAMMLEWLGRRHGMPKAEEAAALIGLAVDQVFADGLLPFELGGSAGTAAIGAAVQQVVAGRREPAAG
jgi:3-isopropylmalate dehydrogenase